MLLLTSLGAIDMSMPPIEVLDALRKKSLINYLLKCPGYEAYTAEELDDLSIEEIAQRIRDATL